MEGEIDVKGSKNTALAALASSLLFSAKGGLDFQNLPEIEDTKRMRELISSIGQDGAVDEEIAKRFRASILVVGPLLARFGAVLFPHPGGCVIGARPIDVFLDGWKAMGAFIDDPGSVADPGSSMVHSIPIYKLCAPNGIRGVDYTFKTQSVTGTEGLMMTALLVKGDTILRNCAMEPEIKYMADFLNKNGAEIKGAGTATLHIAGRNGKLLDSKEPFINPPDRIEAGNFAILGALAAKKLLIKNFPAGELTALTGALKNAGVEFEITPPTPHLLRGGERKNNPLLYKEGKGEVFHSLILKRSKNLRAVSIKTKEYPGFPTDLQAPFAVLATQADGRSMINEAIFEGRLAYTEDLNRMGARITLMDSRRAEIYGPTKLYGSNLESPDLRAGLAFVIAALIAEGESKIGNIYQIDRGYEKIDERLRAIGAEIIRVN